MQAVCSLFGTCVVEQMGTRHWGAFQIIWLIKLKFYEHFAHVLSCLEKTVVQLFCFGCIILCIFHILFICSKSHINVVHAHFIH